MNSEAKRTPSVAEEVDVVSRAQSGISVLLRIAQEAGPDSPLNSDDGKAAISDLRAGVGELVIRENSTLKPIISPDASKQR